MRANRDNSLHAHVHRCGNPMTTQSGAGPHAHYCASCGPAPTDDHGFPWTSDAHGGLLVPENARLRAALEKIAEHPWTDAAGAVFMQHVAAAALDRLEEMRDESGSLRLDSLAFLAAAGLGVVPVSLVAVFVGRLAGAVAGVV